MSGDVQPRKRKDKKRKKEESIEQTPLQAHAPSGTQNEDLNIHVHKEDGTGGGICAKIIFFILFSALAILIGLIITEHRGLTDLDVVEQESRFSQLFEGWVDNSLSHDEHGDEDDHIISSLEDEDHGEESHEEEEEEEEEEGTEEVTHSEEEEEATHSEEEEETPHSEEEEEEEEEEEQEEEAPQTEEDEEEEENVSELKDADEEEEEAEDDDEEENVEEDEEQEASKEVEAEEDEEEEEMEEKAVSEEQEEEEKASVEAKEVSKEEEEESPKDEPIEEKEGDDEQNSKMVVKIGVGVALLVVAHVVLVRKWKSASPPSENATKEEIPDLSRRNTIVVPPSYQEIEQDIEENVEEEYSDEDGEVESDDEPVKPKNVKLKYQELRTTYTRSLTPESEPEYQNKPVEDEDEYKDKEEEDEEEEDYEDEEEEDDEVEDEEESDGGEYEKDEDDDDLLKRLEAKYGKLQRDDKEDEFSSWKRVNVRQDNEPEESDSDKQSDAETYEYENITSKDDYQIKEKIDEAHKNIQNNTAYALKLFDVLLQNYPFSPRILYGKAQCLDLLAEQKRSNDLLQKAISFYLRILDLQNVPDALFETAAERCINRMRFIGNYNRAIDVHYKLIARFPGGTKHRNQLVVSLLTINRISLARTILEKTLSKYPNDGFALVHYGFILKTVDNNLNDSINYLQKGISTNAPGVIDGRFYFHLGDALARVGRPEDAMKVYEDGVLHNLFLSKYQRSLYNVPRLKGQPWWKKHETPYATLYTALETNWEQIRAEGMSVLTKNGQFQTESENLKDTGDWKQFELFARGQKNINNCAKCPITCKIIESVPDAKGCRRGQTKFSVMHPGTHVWPHCGPTNCRLRVHLGLKVPEKTYIRVADEIRSWKEGEVLVFDDSFEHEVWHNGTSLRLVLIVDVWHPELTANEKRTLSPI